MKKRVWFGYWFVFKRYFKSYSNIYLKDILLVLIGELKLWILLYGPYGLLLN